MNLIRKVKLPAPREHQIPILDADARFKVPVCGRRFGKTVMAVLASLLGHGPKRKYRGAFDGGEILWIAPTYKEIVASKVWLIYKYILKDVYVSKNETNRSITLPGGGSITIWSADNPDSIRGGGPSGVICDETADISEETWDVVSPSLIDEQGWAWFTGTPKGDNWYQRMFIQGQEGHEHVEGWQSWQLPTWENAYIQESEIERLRMTLAPYVFSQEIEAKFVSPSAGIFEEEWFNLYTWEPGKEFIRLGDRKIEKWGLRRFLTVDLAASLRETADYTVISSWGYDPVSQDVATWPQ